MSEEDLKRILGESLKPIKEDIGGLKSDVHGLKSDVHGLKSDVHGLKSDVHGLKSDVQDLKTDVKGLKEDVKQLKETQAKNTDLLENRLLPSVTYTENTIKVYSDMYKMNNDNMKRLEKRVETIEEDAGIKVPEELTLKELPELSAQ